MDKDVFKVVEEFVYFGFSLMVDYNVYKALITPVVLYGYKTCTILENDLRRC